MNLRVSTDLIGSPCLAVPSSSVRLGHRIPVSSVRRTKAIGDYGTYQHHRSSARDLHSVLAIRPGPRSPRRSRRISDGFALNRLTRLRIS
jgi:hypothetical protein